MKVISSAIQNGKIDLPYGKFGTQFVDDMPSYSLPFEIINIPPDTISFAVILDDPDSLPVCGFIWTHWLIANLQRNHMTPNESIQRHPDFVQGNNSWNKPQYGGMAPPDKPHKYVLTVYALDTKLPLDDGFSKEELLNMVTGKHLLATATVTGVYPS